MKTMLLLSAVLLLCNSCEPAKPAAAPANSAAQQQAAPQKNSQSLRQEIQSAVDYGIGAAQVEAKRGAVKKIDQISDKHNKDMEEALK